MNRTAWFSGKEKEESSIDKLKKNPRFAKGPFFDGMTRG